MRILLLIVLAALTSQTAAFACDRAASQRVQSMLREMASWSEKNGKVRFEWSSDWDSADRAQRRGLITTFADSDACLTGRAREIEFYRNGKLVGRASPTNGISLTN